MVGCVWCQCLRLECCLLDLLKKCGNCIKNGSTCKLSSTVMDFSQIDCSMAKLEEQEAAAEAEEEAMVTQMLELKEIMN
jgi:hypothetical protein